MSASVLALALAALLVVPAVLVGAADSVTQLAGSGSNALTPLLFEFDLSYKEVEHSVNVDYTPTSSEV